MTGVQVTAGDESSVLTFAGGVWQGTIDLAAGTTQLVFEVASDAAEIAVKIVEVIVE